MSSVVEHEKSLENLPTCESKLCINPKEFNMVVIKLREFFSKIKGFTEVHTQNRLSILAACEDPYTIQTYNYAGQVWPLPQTGQMWLEYELLKDPEATGFFCVSTSYRNEPNPVPGRHDIIFPMFEFEMRGDMEAMIELEKELLSFLGYGDLDFPRGSYKDVAQKYGTKDLSHDDEMRMYEDNGPVFFLTDFPQYTNPFWNMRRHKDGENSYKCDVILSGQETIGSAERSCDPERMKRDFNEIEKGNYSRTLYHHFGEERVDAELKRFLSYEFFPRSGGGIGLTRLIRSLKKEGLLYKGISQASSI